MIGNEEFDNLLVNVLDRNIEENLNQKEAILAPVDESQYLVAGPGSGKTTVIVLKVLKYIFVDDVEPSKIIVTTFTNKAANELKNRTVKWAESIISHLGLDYRFNLNDLIIGTLDSIAEEYVSGIMDVEVIDKFTSSAIMMQTLLTNQRNNDRKLKQFFKRMKNHQGGISTSELNNQIQNLKERLMYDMIDYTEFQKRAGKEAVIYEIITDYYNQLSDRNMLDYSLLERTFHDLLASGEIEELKDVSVVLIDEYQDTNYLQEQIYFKLAEYAIANHGNISVVGDDDQALYRFRGANIDLFTSYADRIEKSLSIVPKTIFLQKNYRSTSNIIDFVNDYISLDAIYQKSRTTNKPPITLNMPDCESLPVFGMFRNNIEELSTDLSNMIYELKTDKSITLERKDKKYVIDLGPNPSLAVLANSPKEISSFNKKRLPFYIRESLQYKDEDLVVFNPRGQNIESTEIVSLLCGLLLVNIDYDSLIEESLDNIPLHTKKILRTWRKQALEYIKESQSEVIAIKEDKINLVELLDTVSKEVAFLTEESNENRIYHDIISDTIIQTNAAINTDGYLTSNQIFWHILVPIATGAIEVDDDMFDFSLEDNVNIMSIHQSKGLEFDVVIVDVGSDIYNNQASSAFKRFPKDGGIAYNLEKYINNTMNLSYISKLSGRDEAFNDLIRRYFVSYTRARKLLVLVGLTSMKDGYKGDFQDNIKIQNVATGWSRDGKWHWDGLDNLIQL
ncbi:MAG: UvrD-helicase domain-containing protein [Methanosphaera sp.]|nr:UvrD-helicase domain-containing protein [Methanosphaera sp.]